MDIQTLIDKAGGAEKLAVIADVSRQRVQDWKRSGTIPGNRVPAICKGLDVAAEDLVPLIELPAPQDERKRRVPRQDAA